MKWLLDTNACIRYLNGQAPRLMQRLESIDPTEVAVCSIVKAELFFGARRSRDPIRTLALQHEFLDRFSSFAFDDACAETYGRIRAELQANGTPIGPNDLLIASIAIVYGLTLVSHNLEEFSRVVGLMIEDWEA